MTTEAAEATSAEGTGTEVGANDLGATSTEGAGGEAVSSAAEEPELYTVMVGGEKRQVTLDDALKGWMRQEDYTRKTQEVSQLRQRLAQAEQLANALERDPHGTMRQLAAVLQWQPEGLQQQVAPEDEDPLARVERQLQGLTNQLTSREEAERQTREEAARQAQAKAQIESELATLHQRYGDFPDHELVQYMVDRGLDNIGEAYGSWQFHALQAQRIAEENAKIEAKRRGQIVSGGSNPSAGSVVPGAAGSKMSVAEAWAAAKAAQST